MLTEQLLKKYRRLYRYQVSGARRRRIAWQFTFEQWLAWWGDDIHQRGGGNDMNSLVMCRRGDCGPYHPDNVYKATRRENLDEQARLQLGQPGRFRKQICTPAGIFDSRKEAAAYYGIEPCSMNWRIKRAPEQYYYL